MNDIVKLPERIGNTPLSALINQPGTEVTVKTTDVGRKVKIISKQQGFLFYGEIEEFNDGTRREVKTLAPQSAIRSKKEMVVELRRKGHTQKQIADELGISQTSVSRLENSY